MGEAQGQRGKDQPGSRVDQLTGGPNAPAEESGEMIKIGGSGYNEALHDRHGPGFQRPAFPALPKGGIRVHVTETHVSENYIGPGQLGTLAEIIGPEAAAAVLEPLEEADRIEGARAGRSIV